MLATADLAPGFPDPVHDAARAFRAILEATSEPGTVVAPPRPEKAPLPGAMAAILLTLCDADTPVHLAPGLDDADVREWIAFHAGAPAVEAVEAAAFVFACAPGPGLAALGTGSDLYPDRSATLVLEVAALRREGFRLTGPGIESERRLGFEAGEGFLHAWRENGALYPRGADLILTSGPRLAALPRTCRIEEA